MKLNRKGYMLVEIVVASVLAMSIAYYLLNLTYSFKDNNEDVYQSYYYTRDKILVTKNIMSDLNKGFVKDIVEDGENKAINFSLCFSEREGDCESRKLLISGNALEYGKFDNENESFDIDDVSYYKKEFESSLVIGNFVTYEGEEGKGLAVTIPINSIYDDEDYSIKLFSM